MQSQIIEKRNTMRHSIADPHYNIGNKELEESFITDDDFLIKKSSLSSIGSNFLKEKGKLSPSKCLDCLETAITYYTKEKNKTRKETLEFSIAKCNLEKAMFLIEYTEEGLTD